MTTSEVALDRGSYGSGACLALWRLKASLEGLRNGRYGAEGALVITVSRRLTSFQSKKLIFFVAVS
jgi:hypothetical protein